MEDLGTGKALQAFLVAAIHSPAPLGPFRSPLKKSFSVDFNGRSSKPKLASSKEPALPSYPPPVPRQLLAPAPVPSLGQNMDAVFIFDLYQAEKEIHFLQLLISEV